HGYYADSSDSIVTLNMEFGWIYSNNITGGNGFQFYDNLYGGAHPFMGCSVHDFIFDGYGKYGLNLGPGALQVQVYNGLILNGVYAPLRTDFYGEVGANALSIDVFYVSTYNCDQLASGSG